MNRNLISLLTSIIALLQTLPTDAKHRDADRYADILYTMMNPADSLNRSRQFYIQYAVEPALQAREEMPWGSKVSERNFRHFVLPLRVNNEAIDCHRPIIYAELRDRIKDLSMTDAILEINHWCHEKATYQPSDGRTHSPLQTLSSAIGRCGEESTFTVATLRAMGIPARQVYTPRWAHTDDNHAWVEAWADGQWYFLGACEPEPVLNLGWFNSPAARGMLMHARVPGSNYDGPEEVLGRFNGNTDINVTANYAPVGTLTVKVVDNNHEPIKNATVSFRIYNYAEFYPIASKTTDNEGTASLTSGLGDLLVWATTDDGKRFGFAKATVGKDTVIEITVDKDNKSAGRYQFDMVPPIQRDTNTPVTEQQRADNNRRLAHEDSIRNAYTSTFASRDYAMRLADSLSIDNADRLFNILQLSRGNWPTISAFLKGINPPSQPKALLLLESLTDKDLSDITLDNLIDHLSASINDNSLSTRYILSPRIANEEITPFRRFFHDTISREKAELYRGDPTQWVRWVADSIDASLSWYPEQATMDPAVVWQSRKTSPLSRDIFFVAGARSFGIPARIDQITSKVQWADNTGVWHDAVFAKQSSGKKSEHRSDATLQLHFKPTKAVDDPKYYAHYTLSKIVDGTPQLQSYPDFMPWSESFKSPTQIEAGQYLLTTGQRMADGSVLATIEIFNLSEGEAMTDSLRLREDPTGIEVIGSFNSENKFKMIDSDVAQSLLSATGRGYFVIGLMAPNSEPTNHALRDIAAEIERLEQWQRPIVLLFDDHYQAKRMDLSLFPKLPSTVIFGTDIEANIKQEIINTLKLDPDKYPIFIIADTFNRVVFVSSGYTIGLGRKIAETVLRL